MVTPQKEVLLVLSANGACFQRLRRLGATGGRPVFWLISDPDDLLEALQFPPPAPTAHPGSPIIALVLDLTAPPSATRARPGGDGTPPATDHAAAIVDRIITFLGALRSADLAPLLVVSTDRAVVRRLARRVRPLVLQVA